MVGNRFVLELVVDSITCHTPELINTPACDLRLSLALSDYPVVHITPRLPDPSLIFQGDPPFTAQFGGAGKLCEFTMTKAALDSYNLILMLLKDIHAIDDYLIITMTAPIGIKELIFSLPNAAPNRDTPFVKRTFSFIDGLGECDVLLRFTRVVEMGGAAHAPVRRTEGVSRPIVCAPSVLRTVQQPIKPPLPEPPENEQIREICSESKTLATRSSVHYGQLRRRVPLIH